MNDDDARTLVATSSVPSLRAPSRPSSQALGELVGPYRLVRAIGSGGSARIDLARLERAYDFQRHVVLKRPLEHLRGDPQVAASLQREARIGGRLRHPNLVSVLDAGEHDGYDYLALEYVHGCSLRSLMQTEKPGVVRDVPLPTALGIVIDVARGLHDAHELTDERGSPLGLVHRDVSPGNVLLGSDGAVKVSDFGIAKETRVSTLSGTLHGTVTYMAPEQCRGHAFDRRADLFSVGVILWELVTRTRLFLADNDVASLHRVLSADVTRPRKLRPEISPALEEIVMMALAHDPERRFATARTLADALEALAASEGYVVGARRLASTVEEAVGARDAPWIASTTVAEMAVMSEPPDPPPAASDGSLIAVIESLRAEPDAADSVPTFGLIDERGKGTEEGWLPTLPPQSTTEHVHPAPQRSRSRLAWIIGGGVTAGLISGVFAMVLGGRHAARPMPTATPANAAAPGQIQPAAPVATAGPAAAAVAPVVDSAQAVPPPAPPEAPPAGSGAATTEPTVAEPTIDPNATHTPTVTGAPGTASHRHHHGTPTSAPKAGSATPTVAGTTSTGTPATAASPDTAGSAAPATTDPAPKPANTHVEWNPDMLMPSDSQHGSGQGSAKPPSK